MIQVANNVTSKTVGNTTSGISLTFDSNGVITSAANVTLSVANTQLTGTINSAQIASNTISNTNIATGAVENYLRANALDFGMRNRIINGTMRIDQRNAGANVSLSSSEQFVVDRFIVQTATGSGNIGARSTTAPAGFTNSIRVRIGTGASPTSGQINNIFQIIEGTNCADLAWGTASARPVTLSFQVRSTLTGTFSGSLRNADGNRSYPFTYTISSANTWEFKSVTIPGDTTGTWPTDTGGSIIVFFDLGSGSTIQGTAGAWAASAARAATGSTQLVGTSGAEFFVTGVQLEEGGTATSHDYRPYGTELNLCYRYFQALGGASDDPVGIGFGAGTTVYVQGNLYQTMRAAPTVSYSGSASGLYLTTVAVGGNLTGFTNGGTGTSSFYIYGGTTASYATYSCVHFRCNSGTKLTASAEL